MQLWKEPVNYEIYVSFKQVRAFVGPFLISISLRRILVPHIVLLKWTNQLEASILSSELFALN